MKRVFISYSSDAKVFAEAVQAKLCKAGIEVVDGAAAVTIGGNFVKDLQQAIADSDVVVVLASKGSRSNSWLEFEVAAAAVNANKRGTPAIVPVYLDGAVDAPTILRQYYGILAKSGSDEDAEKIVSAVVEVFGGKPSGLTNRARGFETHARRARGQLSVELSVTATMLILGLLGMATMIFSLAGLGMSLFTFLVVLALAVGAAFGSGLLVARWRF